MGVTQSVNVGILAMGVSETVSQYLTRSHDVMLLIHANLTAGLEPSGTDLTTLSPSKKSGMTTMAPRAFACAAMKRYHQSPRVLHGSRALHRTDHQLLLSSRGIDSLNGPLSKDTSMQKERKQRWQQG